MHRPIINIRYHDRRLAYTGFSDMAAKRIGMSEDNLLDYLLTKGIFVTKDYLITLAK